MEVAPGQAPDRRPDDAVRVAGSSSVARRLARDPFLWAVAGLLVVVEAIYLLPAVPVGLQAVTTRRLGPIALLVIGIAALTSGLGDLPSRRERRLWRGFLVGLWLWLGIMVLLLLAPAVRPLWVDLVADFSYGVVYLAFILGVEAAPHRGSENAATGGGLTAPGATVLVTGLVLYFVFVPASVDVATYSTMVPSMFLFMALDSYLVARLALFWFETRDRRWRILYAVLLASNLAYFSSDLTEALAYAKIVSLSPQTPLALLWLMPSALLVVAARLRHVVPADREPEKAEGPAPGETLPGGYLIAFAAVFPFLHLAGYQLGLFDEASRGARDALVAAWIVLLGGLALVQQRWLSGRTLRLAKRGSEATEALRRKEQMLRLVLEQQRAEEARRLSEEKFRRVFHSSPDPMVLAVMPEGRVIEANGGFETLLGRGREEILGRTARELGIWESDEQRASFLERVEREGSVRDLALELRSAAGEMRSLLVSADVLDLDGERVLLAVSRDVTERKALERQLWRSQRMETIGNLAGGVAHDLNNILSPIVLALQLLERQTLDEQGRWILSNLEASATRGTEMVRQILTFARGRDGELEDVTLAEAVDELVAILRPTFPKSIRIRPAIPAALEPVRADPTQLHQVLMNLCVNARDAMPEGGELSIRAEEVVPDGRLRRHHPHLTGGPMVRIEVADEGCGIEDAILDRIFDPFFTTKERGRGSGLGLATAAGIVRGHGGAIEVESEPGRGSRFSVYLPLAPGAEGRLDAAVGATAPPGEGQLVLVVDDEKIMREIASQILEVNGYRVATAASGDEALERLEEADGAIDVVLMDVMMPDGDGMETLQELRVRRPGLPVVLSSGLVDSEMLGDLTSPPPEEFLAKPYSAAELLAALQRALSGSAGALSGSLRRSDPS